MALSYPLSLAAFADTLGIRDLSLRAGRQTEFSSLGSGEAIVADIAPARREYDVGLDAVLHADARALTGLLEALEADTDATFYIGDPRHLGPASDPAGSALSGHTVLINSLNANSRALSLKGLPADFALTRGDALSWDYGASPTRRAYHRAAESVAANGSGTTAEFEVRDFIRVGSTTDLVVTLYKPAFKAQIVRGSIRESAQGDLTRVTFTVRQVL